MLSLKRGDEGSADLGYLVQQIPLDGPFELLSEAVHEAPTELLRIVLRKSAELGGMCIKSGLKGSGVDDAWGVRPAVIAVWGTERAHALRHKLELGRQTPGRSRQGLQELCLTLAGLFR